MLSQIPHNIFFGVLGVVQWTFTEAAFIYCYQTNRVAYTLSLKSALFWACWISIAHRDIHLYFSHRFIHINFIYKYVHAVHHRNIDIEPFAGLCMHPTEHLYSYSFYGPLLLFRHHPFVIFWMGMLTVVSPAANHSGFEDHAGADLQHYLHHRYYECNYGGRIPFDVWFGCFKDKLNESTATPPTDSKAHLGMILEYPLFELLGVALPIAMLVAFCCQWEAVPEWWTPDLVAWSVTMAPIVASALLFVASAKKTSRHMLAPFHKEALWSQVLHHVLGFYLGVYPVYQLLSVALAAAPVV